MSESSDRHPTPPQTFADTVILHVRHHVKPRGGGDSSGADADAAKPHGEGPRANASN